MSDQKIYHPIFLNANGPGPWACYGCGEDVHDLLVHHIDRNHKNNAPDNLAAMHSSCHMSLHLKGTTKTPEHRAKLAAALAGKPLPQETRLKISAALKGRPKPPRTDEHRKNLSIGRTGKGLGKGHPWTDEFRKKYSEMRRGVPPSEKTLEHLRRLNASKIGKPNIMRRWRCGECDLTSTGSGIQKHQKKSGHEGRVAV